MREFSPSVFAKRLELDSPLSGPADLAAFFPRLQALPHCVWLDSASDHQYDRGRYSFLSADPVAWFQADLNSPDPWPVLRRWCQRLEQCRWSHPPEDIPPFCGGIVALLAYEAMWWLEPGLREQGWAGGGTGGEVESGSRQPAMAIGLYDWTLAIDHREGQMWMLSTGLDEHFQLDRCRAERRAEEVMRRLPMPPLELLDKPLQHKRGFSDIRHSASLTSNFTDAQFAAGVAEIIARIRRGDFFQVNLAQTLSYPATCQPAELYERLRRINPAPYACYFDAGDYQVIGSSPEGFLQVRAAADGGRHVVTRPIKGTVVRTGDPVQDARLGSELLASEKDRAENIMIVDLMRNDLSRVCRDESVQVVGLCELECYQRVQHLVSTVRGQLLPEAGVADLLAACFPGGSITGAPKVEAMRMIASLEQRPRGPYCGSLGYISLSGAADFNILIRTVTQRCSEHGETVWEFPVGGGITARSNPQQETQETWVKAASLLEAITAAG